jgi:hypothetical protein
MVLPLIEYPSSEMLAMKIEGDEGKMFSRRAIFLRIVRPLPLAPLRLERGAKDKCHLIIRQQLFPGTFSNPHSAIINLQFFLVPPQKDSDKVTK